MKRLLFSFIGTFFCILSFAITQPVDGKYYRIANQNPEKSINTEGVKRGYVITENPTSYSLTAEEPGSDSKYNQIWKYTNGKFQNAHTSRYINTLSRSVQGVTSKTGATVAITNNSTYFLLTCGMQIHADGSNVIVGWNDEQNKSNWWDFEEVTVDMDALAKVQEAYAKEQAEKANLENIAAKESTYAKIVEGYFKDVACTELKDAKATLSDEEMTEMMTADGLPTEVQAMVLNIKNKWADEYNAAFSEKFRVQKYKAYPVASEAKAYTKATQISDMNNITGIWTDALQLLYIFVEGEIPSNATLSLAQTSGDLGRAWSGQGAKLHSGMNIVYCGTKLANNWIMYTVPFSSTKPIKDYPELKIHIEGGNVIGYTDINPLDEEATNAEYAQNLALANGAMKAVYESRGENLDMTKSRIDYCVRGQYGMMLWPLECYNQIWSTSTKYGAKIWKSMMFYENVLMWEWGAMGITKRVANGEAANTREHMTGGFDIVPTYVNNLAPTMMMFDGGKNPYSSDGYTCMPGVWGVESSYNAERADFDVWCCGHESGHNNQQTINLPSSMESSNNYFSNLIQYQCGYRLSRGWSFMENIEKYYGTTIFPHRDISITLRMYYNLYLYYHRAGNKTDFSPRLHELLRKDGMSFGGNGWYEGPSGGANRGDAKNSWLKFYEKVCEAAQEDLTEYFRMWGFFIPVVDAYCGDYSSYYITCKQADIDAAIKRVKSKGYRENKEIMFIEDRLKPQKRWDFWDEEGASWKVTSDGGNASNETQLKQWFGDLGYADEYIKGQASKAEGYTYMVTGSEVKMTGNGGVGIIVYNEDGTIAYLSNRLKFTLPSSVALSNYSIKVISGDGTEYEATDATDGGKESQVEAILKEAIAATATYTSMMDETSSKVGYYLPSALKNLNDIVAEANQALADKNTSEYIGLYNRLNQEVERVKSSAEKVQIAENGVYTLKNNSRGRYLTSGASTSTDASAANAKWTFVKNGTSYYMQNYESEKLVNGIYDVSATELSAASSIKVVDAGNGCWYLKLNNSEGSEKCLNNTPSEEKVIGWSEDSGSQWYITKVMEIEEVTKEDIDSLVAETQELIAEVAKISVGYEKKDLQCTDENAANYIGSYYTDEAHPIANLIDNDKTTDFYTTNSKTSLGFYFYIDLGEGNGAKQVRLTMTTPTGGLVPATMVVTPGESDTKYIKAQETQWTGLPTGEDGQVTKAFTTNETDKEYRFWRFRVTSVYGSTALRFGLAEVQFRLVNTKVTYNEGYEAVDKTLLLKVDNARKNATSKVATLNTMLRCNAIIAELRKAYKELQDAIVATSIEHVVATDGKTIKGIYDLQGRAINKITKSGIYVVDGKKVFVK